MKFLCSVGLAKGPPLSPTPVPKAGGYSEKGFVSGRNITRRAMKKSHARDVPKDTSNLLGTSAVSFAFALDATPSLPAMRSRELDPKGKAGFDSGIHPILLKDGRCGSSGNLKESNYKSHLLFYSYQIWWRAVMTR